MLELLFPSDWLKKKFRYAFILGVCYSIIGIIGANILFPANTGIVSVIFISFLLSPSLREIFASEEKDLEKEKKFSFKRMILNDYDIITTYFLIFFGIFLTYLLFSFLLPQWGINTFNILKEQLFMDPTLRGHAAFSISSFESILYNNWWVLMAAFALAIIGGNGAIFFITWNASAWGTVFGYRALSAATFSGNEPWFFLVILLSIVIWHSILEGLAYMMVGISGSTLSNEIIKEKVEIKEFVLWAIIGGILFIACKFAFGLMKLSQMVKLPLYFALTLVLLHILGKIVAEKKNKIVFTYSIILFVAGILIFVLGAALETSVLSNSITLNKIYILSTCYSQVINVDQCNDNINSIFPS